MKTLFKSKKFLILAIIVVGIVLFANYYQPAPSTPKLLLSSPIDRSEKVDASSPIKLKFDKPVDLSLLTISSIPPEEWSVASSEDPNEVIVNSKQYFHSDRNYSVSIIYNNELISTLNFKTIASQGDPRYTQEVLSEMEKDYPLALKLPHKTTDYLAAYDNPLSITIIPLTSSTSNDELIRQVQAWVNDNGIDPATHKYTISTPTPSPRTP